MDFITGLPVSEGYDAIFVAMDKLSKRAKYAPTYTTVDAKDTAQVFFMLWSAATDCRGSLSVIVTRDSSRTFGSL